MTYHGSTIVQQMVQFSYVSPVVASMMDLSLKELETVACSTEGSFLMETFLKSTGIGKKDKESFIEKLQVCEVLCAPASVGLKS